MTKETPSYDDYEEFFKGFSTSTAETLEEDRKYISPRSCPPCFAMDKRGRCREVRLNLMKINLTSLISHLDQDNPVQVQGTEEMLHERTEEFSIE